jgi:hypothetical protein
MNQGRYFAIWIISKGILTILAPCEPFPVGSGLKNAFLSGKNNNPREELPYLDVT